MPKGGGHKGLATAQQNTGGDSWHHGGAQYNNNNGGTQHYNGGAQHINSNAQIKGGARLNNFGGGGQLSNTGNQQVGGGYPISGGNMYYNGGGKCSNYVGGDTSQPDAGGSQRPSFGPPNSIPCANGTSAWCKRCGAPNDIRAPKCDTCNLQLLVGGYPSEPPPGNNGGNQYKGAHFFGGKQQPSIPYNSGAQRSGPPQGDVQNSGGLSFGGAQHYSGAQHTSVPFNGGPQFIGAQNVSVPTKGGGKGGGKGTYSKWCQGCGQQNPHFHKWCNACHLPLPHTGKGNSPPQVQFHQQPPNNAFHQSAPHGGAHQPGGDQPPHGKGAVRFVKGGYPGSDSPQSHAKGGQQQPYNLDPHRFGLESSLYPGRIPRCFEVGFEAGQYIAPVNLSPVAQWKANCEYLNHIKMIQTKVDNYKNYLKEAEAKLLSLALPAWKHHKELESTVVDLPNAAKGLHTPPLHLLAEIMFDQINDDDKKTAFEALVIDILKDQAQPTPLASPAPRDQYVEEADQQMEPIDVDESFEIPQWVPAQQVEVLDPNEVEYLRELEEELTPCLPKRQRLFEKTPNNIAVLGKTAQAEQSHVGKGKGCGNQGRKDAQQHLGASSSDDDSDTKMTKREKREAAKQRKKDALLAATPASAAQTRKSINKPKKY